MADEHLNERIDDVIHLLGPHGYKGSRAEVIRRAIFALPLDDEEHLARLMQYGGLREREARGAGWSEDALAECEGLLGWWREDAETAALVRELDDLRHRLSLIAGDARDIHVRASMQTEHWWQDARDVDRGPEVSGDE